MGLRLHHGFGCMESSPGQRWRVGRGFLLHGYSVYLLGHECKIFIDFFLGQVYDVGMKDEPFKLTSEAAKKLSQLGAAKGGEARASKLSPERRREIARAAVQTRWEKAGKAPLARATHKGSFKEEFGVDVDCYVLDDEQKTAVISQTGMARALAMSSRGSSFPNFLATRAMAGAVSAELREKLANPIRFQWGTGGGEIPPTTVHGFDATLLVDVCKAIVAAEAKGEITKRQAKIAQQAHVVLGASAKAGIKGLVYALAGYDATREEVIAAFKFYVREEAREYEKEFPDQLYAEWYRLYNVPKPARNKPWKFKHLTVEQVYRPLARSNGKILQLTRKQRVSSETRYKKLHQFLSEIGVKALRTHLGQLLGVARISKDGQEYEEYVDTLFGEQRKLFRG